MSGIKLIKCESCEKTNDEAFGAHTHAAHLAGELDDRKAAITLLRAEVASWKHSYSLLEEHREKLQADLATAVAALENIGENDAAYGKPFAIARTALAQIEDGEC